MSEEEKRLLQQKLWAVCNTLRGRMNGDEFRDYILGFIFLKFLSEQFHRFANEVLAEDGLDFAELDCNNEEHIEIIEEVHQEAIESLGYALFPTDLFDKIVKKGQQPEDNFILPAIQDLTARIEKSAQGTASEEDFINLFEDLDLNSSKLGKSAEQRNKILVDVLSSLNEIDFKLHEIDADVLGDSYEYLIANFASDAGKKAGEFYTPASVSEILSQIVSLGKDKLRSVYDPTCGSGSLLLRIAKQVDYVADFYGQEFNRTTYNLARMNMILHGVPFRNFSIQQDDTLEHPQHKGMKFEAIVANPPFSVNWSANPLFLSDERFSDYGKLAPKTKADFAFIQHMLYHLDDNGTMAVVVPHGVLFRGAAEGHIRQHMIEKMNVLDAVIGLPENIFFGTGIPTAILVFKKCREHSDDILFVDGSKCFEKGKNQNRLTDDNIDTIIEAYKARKDQDKFSHVAPLSEIRENDYNLNIPRYVDTFEDEEPIDLELVGQNLRAIDAQIAEVDKELSGYLAELGIESPFGGAV